MEASIWLGYWLGRALSLQSSSLRLEDRRNGAFNEGGRRRSLPIAEGTPIGREAPQGRQLEVLARVLAAVRSQHQFPSLIARRAQRCWQIFAQPSWTEVPLSQHLECLYYILLAEQKVACDFLPFSQVANHPDLALPEATLHKRKSQDTNICLPKGSRFYYSIESMIHARLVCYQCSKAKISETSPTR